MKKLRPTIVMTNFLLSVCLASLIFCSFLAPAVGATELKAHMDAGIIGFSETGMRTICYD